MNILKFEIKNGDITNDFNAELHNWLLGNPYPNEYDEIYKRFIDSEIPRLLLTSTTKKLFNYRFEERRSSLHKHGSRKSIVLSQERIKKVPEFKKFLEKIEYNYESEGIKISKGIIYNKNTFDVDIHFKFNDVELLWGRDNAIWRNSTRLFEFENADDLLSKVEDYLVTQEQKE